MNYFDFQKLEVYQRSLEFLTLVRKTQKLLPRGTSNLSDQLDRASTSITLNIAEGAGEYVSKEKARFYRIAKRSATECASVFEILMKLELIENDILGRDFLIEIVSMLTRMIRNQL